MYSTLYSVFAQKPDIYYIIEYWFRSSHDKPGFHAETQIIFGRVNQHLDLMIANYIKEEDISLKAR